MIVCEPLATVNDCWTIGAGLKVLPPPWFALITHVPAAMNDTIPVPDIEQTATAGGSIEKATGKPDDAVPAGLYNTPPTTAACGAPEVIVIVCKDNATPNDWVN